MNTKFDVGDKVSAIGEIQRISITSEGGVCYFLSFSVGGEKGETWVTESEVSEVNEEPPVKGVVLE